ncbi:MAG TPA: Stk1 family PASTA domain-containing Ser/Thr kinase [Gaiellaceae bacterium]|nr:Stk1 family PASTA domain-containing Ser/Thr kinase [Gaiellaceae bacterium]
MATFDTLIDRVLDGRYRVVSKLGSGGMASVYLAEDQELGRRVAIKLLDERHAQDEQFVERFRREAESAAGLSHPNVVSIYDRGEAEGTYYIAMEFLEGKTLKELLVSRGPTPVRVAIDYTRQILSALDFAHRHGIVHRDIKPHNVVVAPDGRLKVTDFGIARSGSSQVTEAGSIIGTAQYLSPEQAKGAPVHPSSDLYSVGIVLYEMLTGAVPFTGETALEIAMKHLSTVPEPPSLRRPPGLGDVPHALDQVVLRALAKDPAERYQSARDMDADLARVAQGLPVSTETETAATAVLAGAGIEPTQVVPRAQRGRAGGRVPPYGRYLEYEHVRRRRPVWPWLIAALLLAAAGYAGYFVYTKIEHQLSSGPVPVNIYTGILEGQARKKVLADGLQPRIRRVPNEKVPVGQVFDQNPDPGARVNKGTVVTLTVSTGKPKVEVPAVKGDSLADAVAALTKAGLNYHSVEVPSSAQPGTVTAQSPAAGTRVVKGTDVRINISKGLPEVPVPTVAGDSEADARTALQDAGFTVGPTQLRNSDQPAGVVIDTTPAQGTLLQRGSEVSLVVSKGPQTGQVPDVTGLPVADAASQLANKGFKVATAKLDTSDQTLDGTVMSQSPLGGTEEPLGTTVTLEVGHYVPPPPSGPTGATGPTGPSGPSGPSGATGGLGVTP